MYFKDPDQDHDIHYILVRDMTDGRFEVDEYSGLFCFYYTKPTKDIGCFSLISGANP